MCMQNLKSVAFPVPEIIGGTQKNWAVPGYAHAPFFQNFSWAFIPMDPLNVLAKFEICSFPRSWDNRRYPKNFGSPWIRPRSLFSEIFNGLLFGWTLWMYWPNLKSSLSRSWDNRGYPKILDSPWIRPLSLCSKIFHGLLFGWKLLLFSPNLKFVA